MGERELIGLLGLAALLALIGLRMPVGLAMLAVGIGGNFALSIAAPFLRFEPFILGFKSLIWSTLANDSLSVVPLFLLMGMLASHAGLSRDLFAGLNALIGRRPGGVAMAAIGACAGFGAVSGSSLATASTMGRVALPELARLGYDRKLATGTLAAGGTLGILIPPSVALVLYAIIVEAPIVELFQAAIVPGLLAVFFFIAVIWVSVRRNPSLAPPAPPLSAVERRRAILRLLPVAGIFAAIIAGLGLGFFTPTPAAAIGVLLVFVYGIARNLFDTGLTLGGIKDAVLETAVTTGMIALILLGAEVLKGFFARSNLPNALADFAGSGTVDPWFAVAIILLSLVVLGCLLESLTLVLVVVPFLWPSLIALNGGAYVSSEDAAFGIDLDDLKLWFGILALVVVELGLISPPIGLNVFVIGQLAGGTALSDVFRGVLPFFLVEWLRVGLLLAFPALSLWLPWFLRG